jgi:uncharacterized Zn finger protein
MPARICSHCGQPGRLLEMVSLQPLVDYYRCDSCGQVWAVNKADTTLPPQIISPPITP